MSNETNIKDLRLNCDSVDAKPRNVDWRELLGEDLEGWEAFAVEECEECGRSFIVSSNMGEDEHRYIEPEFEDEDGEEVENECMGTCGYFEGPMMNHFYPCAFDDAEEAARAIAHLPLCVVVMQDGETGFALTGGGMDLSWEICDAYLSCGFLPPFHFCDLPDMAGKGREPRAQLILEACRESVRCLAGWTESRLRKLDHIEQKLKESAA